MTRRRVVITGCGIVAPLGDSPSQFFDALMVGRSGVGMLRTDFAHVLECKIGAQVAFDPALHFTRPQIASLDRASQLAIIAAKQAINAAALDPAKLQLERCGVTIGTGMGSINTVSEGCLTVHRDTAAKLRPRSVVTAMPNSTAAHVAMLLGFQGQNLTYSVACSSSSVAIGEAARMIRHGYADCILAGGTESVFTLEVIRSWEAARALARTDSMDPSRSCKPFSANRNGTVLGEGAGMLVIEALEHAQARGASITAEIAGYATANDVAHIVQPSVAGQAAAMRACLTDARLDASVVDYINAHGTGTLWNDRIETAAIKSVFGERAKEIPVSSTKSMHGHLLGASGVVEVIAAVEALQRQAVPPTINLDIPDPECDLDYVPHKGRPVSSLRTIMKNAFGFGGTSACLLLTKSDMSALPAN